MPPARLFVVRDVFSIAGRGLVLTPGIPAGAPALKLGDAIEIRRPDGTTVSTKVGGLGLFGRALPTDSVPLLVPITGAKSQVPPGSEVWA